MRAGDGGAFPMLHDAQNGATLDQTERLFKAAASKSPTTYQLRANVAIDEAISLDAVGALAPGFKWERVEPDPLLTSPPKWAWRNGEGIVRLVGLDAGGGRGAHDSLAGVKLDKTFHTQYSQTWSYVDLALRHIYECVRLMALRGQQLRAAGDGATDSRLAQGQVQDEPVHDLLAA